MVKILLVGPLPPPIGGATVLFKQLVDELHEQTDVKVAVVNTARPDARSRLRNAIKAVSVTKQIICGMSKADVVSFHGTIGGICLYAPVLIALATAFRKPVIIRIFGGWIANWHRAAKPFWRWLFSHSVLKSNLVLIETKSAVEYFAALSRGKIEWYPNSRRMVCQPRAAGASRVARRFVYVGHICAEKGVRVLISIESRLPPGVTIDVYGPLMDDFVVDDFSGERVVYRGILDGNNVIPVLTEYDALLFPSCAKTEGYPGVLIESFLAGIPVITTGVGGIPEIVDESRGIFVSPGSESELSSAIFLLHENAVTYSRLCAGAAKAGKSFDSQQWTRAFVDMCKRVRG
jgi:glycosyltransferase involved in cell wall biosynthesis